MGDTTKKKKKGRPSLLDLQKRALKQQQLQNQHNYHQHDHNHHRSKNPNSLNHVPNSKIRNPNSNGVISNSPWIKNNEDNDGDERQEKKHRLLHGLNSHSHNSQLGGSELNLDDPYTGEKALKATDILQGSPVESGPTTPLPDKKLLLFILDRLQKKDTYGVYSDPVNPEELPDYHEIIKNPMDFSTVRKKLDSGAYASLEQFESDVFLICTNAMEYNSADTIYYRQARAIQELAKKNFENLRRDSDDEKPQNQQQQQQQQPKVAKRGRPPKKQPEPSSIDRTASELSADALIPASGAYNLRKTPSYKFRQAGSSVRISHNSETQSGFSIDWENEFPPSVVKAVNKYGMKHVDDNRRDTYNHLSTSTQEPSVLTMIEEELKQLIPVGLNTEYGYARSLARYAASPGPVAWKIASRRIETVLPSGIKFGLGWVGENPEGGPEEDDSQKKNLLMSSEKQKCSNDLGSDDHSRRIMSPTASVSSAFIGNRHFSSRGVEETAPLPDCVLNPEKNQSSSSSHQSRPMINPESSIRGLNGFSHNASQMFGTARQQQPKLTEETTLGSKQQRLLFPCNKQEFNRFPPDLNTRLVSPNSPSSNPQSGSSSSQHPDLALQL